MADIDETDQIQNVQILKRIEKAFKTGGVPAAHALVSKSLDQWKDVSINVGITGNSGVGKSSFINTLRGLKAWEKGAAEVGVAETTKKPTPYKHPNNEKMLLWDLPGVGTPTFKQDTYLDKINVDLYDYFIIIAACRFTENDKWLGEELTRRRKSFYFVRSKIAVDVQNDRDSHPRSHNEQTVISKIKDDCMKHIRHFVTEVYLIDNFKPGDYDFPRFSDKLIVDAPVKKRESILLTLNCFSERLIFEKKKVLRRRIAYVAPIAGLSGAIPFPGLDFVFDMAIIGTEFRFYKKTFGLSGAALTNYAQNIDMSKQQLIQKLDLKSKKITWSFDGLAELLVTFNQVATTLYTTTKFASQFVPVVGSIIGCKASILYCDHALMSLLEITADDAVKLNSYN